MKIDPKWKYAIDVNVCPFCGRGIMEEHLKNLLFSLRDTIDQLQKYPEQLDDWMLSNYNYIKTDSPDLKLYMPKDYVNEMMRERDLELSDRKIEKKKIIKVETENGEEEVVAEKIQDDEKTADFFKRAEVSKPKIDGKITTIAEKNEHLKKMAQQIKRAGATVVNAAGAADIISPEMIENADPEAVAEMQAILTGNESIMSSLSDMESNDDDPPDYIVNALNNRAAKMNGDTNAADMAKHQRMYDRVNRSKKNFSSGGGGFSRA
jgi:hypothetical protein